MGVLDAAGESSRADSLFVIQTADARGNQEPTTMLRCHVNQEVQILEAGLDQSLGERRISKLPEYLIVHLARFAWRQDTNENAKVLRPVSFPHMLDVEPLCTDELKKSLVPVREKLKARREREVESAAAADPSTVQKLDPKSGYYELASVISHKGRSLDGGHYVAWARKGSSWLIFDDDHVGPVSSDDIARLKGV